MPFSHNLVIHAGAVLRARFDWIGDNNQPVDLTGWAAVAQVRSQRGTADADGLLLTLSTDAGSIALGADGGIVLHLTHAQTGALTFAAGVWDLLLRDPDGDVHPPLIEGRVTVIRTITAWPA